MVHSSCDGKGYSIDLTEDDAELTVALSEAIAEIEGVDTNALPPLAETVPGESLEALTDGHESVIVSFKYCSYQITVHGEQKAELEQVS